MIQFDNYEISVEVNNKIINGTLNYYTCIQ